VLFNSVTFLVLFLPLSLLIYYLLGHLETHAAKAWLVVVSLLFYGWWNPDFLILLLASILFNYACGYSIQILQAGRVSFFLMWAGIAVNLGALFYYKYLLTLMDWLHGMGFHHGEGWGSVILPLGISFFTFTQIGFLVDTQAGNAKERGFLEYMLFVTFFPHLLAGPILHHAEIMPQFVKKETYFFRPNNIIVGISIFILGLGKKVLIADQLAPIANDVFQQTADKHILEAWTGIFCYSFQLYFDFAGYSEMALGLARMFNVTFPANFDSPFKSKSMIEFWQRWHISLTRYFTLYLYNPLSLWIMRRRASRGLPMPRAGETTWKVFMTTLALPTFFTMGLMGIWHGAGIQFLIFGLLNGFYLCVNHIWRLFGPRPAKTPLRDLRSWFDGAWKWAATYLSVSVALIFFKANSLEDAFALVRSLFGGGTGDSAGGAQGVVEAVLDRFGVAVPYWNYSNSLATLAFLFIFILVLPNVLQLFHKEETSLTKIHSTPALFSFEWRPNILWGIFLAVLALADLLMVTGTTEFLYFKL
jgi:D-alanyl-lipoteichoic acid acyltransferase DltB (MBOAT superfamily)